ncbi:hypothetical protein A3A93_04015 [Candidatus Roizmanbacteria bacterium RIFCSPLOWO2_01_FULL_38_12]|uniref:HD domain-containing protein n=1 Tax=Candidatus Roizmanbacteria bacterium RIFCSPLOWO2_01_FULL_38_12 TaxID=1802061 RepID=A0A1F7ITS5_9BACT|nr:MAG: hypothetical protein A3A93_04015 [Candidatus Roizmanbacteria bacterium RIFCSPLOWO2_01_FULL_38_12]
MDEEITRLFEFFKTVEKLKTELRHSWTSDASRRESVAEHTWMLSLMTMLLSNKPGVKIDQLKAIKMAITHDLVETIARDVPSHEISDRQDKKRENEQKAIETLKESLGGDLGQEILSLWTEFEGRQTNEAKFVHALDKFECLFEHNLADISTWDEGDYRYTFVEVQDTPFDFDSFMRRLKDRLDEWTNDKLTKAGTLSKVPEENLTRYTKRDRN